MMTHPPRPPRPPARTAAVLGSLAAAGWLLASCASMSVDAPSALQAANTAMGGTALQSIRFSGSGTGATFGQAFTPGMAWPRINYSVVTRAVNYADGSMREDAARSRAEPSGGGAVPLMGQGEQRTIGLVKGDKAWNQIGPAVAPAPVAVHSRVHDLWTTPHGVLKAALRNAATASKVDMNGKSYTAVKFTQPGAFSATVYINADHLVERIDSVQPHPVSGDTATTTTFSGYKDHNGVKFPSRIQQSAGGYEVADLNITEVAANSTAPIEVPALVAGFAERVTSEKVADGVWYLAGGSHHSVAIEMRDHMIVVESPLYDGRAQAMLAEVKKLSPKPIKYVINSHHHFDHAGGLRAAAAEGAEIIVAEAGRAYFERLFANGNTIAPDALQKSGKRASFSGYDGNRVLTDGSRTVELHAIDGGVHARGFNMVWLPKERLLIQADAFTPGAPNSPPPARANDNNVNLAQNIDRLKLNVDKILPLHGRVVPYSELLAAIGRR